MSDLSVTAANVLAGEGATKETGIAGAAITAGQTVFKDSADGKYKLADSNHATAANRVPRGVALNTAGTGQPLQIATKGPVTIGATLTAGVSYYQSDSPGGICPLADVGSGEYATFIGIATSTTVLDVGIKASGATLS